MSFPATPDPRNVPLNVLFPEEYERSARMVTRDFALFGVAIVVTVLAAAIVNFVAAA